MITNKNSRAFANKIRVQFEIMTIHRQIKMENQIKELSAEFFERELNVKSLVTVTNIFLSPNYKHVDIFLSILPEKDADSIIKISREKTGELRKYLSQKMKIRFLPEIEIKHDLGEKNRQRIEELLNQK
ncbi:MAG: Ribosome-binding factor A, partial [Candidatus Nomurabacteria bacterium GW2011_GWB1_37_5]